MKIAVLFFAVVCIGLKTCEAQRICKSKRDCDKIFTVVTQTPTTPDPLTNNNETLKEQLLEAAVEETQNRLAILERQSKELELSPVDAKLGQILRSNDRAREIGRAALTQLNFLRAFKELFDNRNRNAAAAAPDSEDFFQALDRVIGGNILGVQRCSVRRQKRMAPTDCPFPCVVCTKAQKKVRQFNGQCNNLGNPRYGSANIAQSRMWDAAYYDDDIEEFRKSVTGDEDDPVDLPSARDVAQKLLKAEERNDKKASHFTMQVGQFLDHDLVHTPIRSTGSNDEVIHCGENCDETIECKPIKTGPNTCMEFVRSEVSLKTSCPLEPIIPTTTITSWIDASQVYGSSDAEAETLREMGTGLMKVTDNPLGAGLKKYLPHNTPEGDRDCKKEPPPVRPCFLAGDVRQNEQLGLTAIHTVFVRMHNYIAKQLKTEKQMLGNTPNRLFQLTRKILIGFWQHIVYSEYLPAVLGSNFMNEFDLYPQTDGFFEGYDNSIRPDVSVEFSTAAFRFGHTQIKEKLKFDNAAHTSATEYFLSTIQFNPHRLYTSGVSGVSGVDAVIQGQLSVPDGGRDNKFTDQVRNHLFESLPNDPGLDLPALNIQRGRDHGIPSYLTAREELGLDDEDGRPTEFNQLKSIRGNPNRFGQVYESVEDIDLYAGGINEKKAPGAQMGRTFGNIIAMHFRKLKFGDRFYYERKIGNKGFNKEQLEQVRRISLARILCDTLDEITKIQPRALFLPSVPNNKRVSCNNNNKIKDIDYSVFV